MIEKIEITNRPGIITERGYVYEKMDSSCQDDFRLIISHGNTVTDGPVAYLYTVEVAYKNTHLFKNFIFDVAHEDNYYSQTKEFFQRNNKKKHFLNFVNLMQRFAIQFCENPYILFTEIAATSYDNGFQAGQCELQLKLKGLLNIE